jgi:hypothetical protein
MARYLSHPGIRDHQESSNPVTMPNIIVNRKTALDWVIGRLCDADAATKSMGQYSSWCFRQEVTLEDINHNRLMRSSRKKRTV